MMTNKIKICGCYASQPIGEFFVGVIPSDILCKITYTDTRRINSRTIEEYAGLNRPINPVRVKEISGYVGTIDATFPSSIIVAIDSKDIINQDEHSLTIKIQDDVAKIIDGQHRISGLQQNQSAKFDLVVSIFVDIPVEDQAEIFSVINLKQIRVDQSNVYDLFDLKDERSPQKTSHDIAKSINTDSNSPFYRRIKMLGRNPKLLSGEVLYKAPLSQAAFIKQLLPLISDNPDRDRDLLRRGLEVNCSTESKAIFCKYFKNGEDTAILKIMNNYFTAVKEVFPQEWESSSNPLSKTIGYGALMRLLRTDLFPLGQYNKDLSKDFFYYNILKAKGLIDLTFNEYAPAGSGETKLYQDFRKYIILG